MNKEQHSVTVHCIINGSIKYRLRKWHIGTLIEFRSLYGFGIFPRWAFISLVYVRPVWTFIVKKKERIEETKLAAPCRCSGAARGQRLIFWCARWKGETDMCTVTRMCGRTVALAERWPCLIAVRSRTSALTLIAECHTLCELHERNDCPPHLISVINFTFVRSPFQCNLVLCVATYIHYSLSG